MYNIKNNTIINKIMYVKETKLRRYFDHRVYIRKKMNIQKIHSLVEICRSHLYGYFLDVVITY